ncbi:MAG: hypothetical protein AAGA29_05715 [Planctomycetota bacterium]
MPEHGRNGELIQAKYPDETKRRLVHLLDLRRRRSAHRDEAKPVPAIYLANALNLKLQQSRESRRRRIRELVDEARREGAAIASDRRGYWAAETVEDYQAHLGFMRRMGLGVLASAARAKRSAGFARAQGQMILAPLAHLGLTGGLSFYLNGREQSPPTNPPSGEPGSTDFGPLFGPG